MYAFVLIYIMKIECIAKQQHIILDIQILNFELINMQARLFFN